MTVLKTKTQTLGWRPCPLFAEAATSLVCDESDSEGNLGIHVTSPRHPDATRVAGDSLTDSYGQGVRCSVRVTWAAVRCSAKAHASPWEWLHRMSQLPFGL